MRLNESTLAENPLRPYDRNFIRLCLFGSKRRCVPIDVTHGPWQPPGDAARAREHAYAARARASSGATGGVQPARAWRTAVRCATTGSSRSSAYCQVRGRCGHWYCIARMAGLAIRLVKDDVTLAVEGYRHSKTAAESEPKKTTAFDAKTLYGALKKAKHDHSAVTDEESLRSAFEVLEDAGSLFPGGGSRSINFAISDTKRPGDRRYLCATCDEVVRGKWGTHHKDHIKNLEEIASRKRKAEHQDVVPTDQTRSSSGAAERVPAAGAAAGAGPAAADNGAPVATAETTRGESSKRYGKVKGYETKSAAPAAFQLRQERNAECEKFVGWVHERDRLEILDGPCGVDYDTWYKVRRAGESNVDGWLRKAHFEPE